MDNVTLIRVVAGVLAVVVFVLLVLRMKKKLLVNRPLFK